MSFVYKGFSKVINLWPDVDYYSYIPKRTASSEAWESVGNNMIKVIISEALKSKITAEELVQLNFAIEELERRISEVYVNESMNISSAAPYQKKHRNSEASYLKKA